MSTAVVDDLKQMLSGKFKVEWLRGQACISGGTRSGLKSDQCLIKVVLCQEASDEGKNLSKLIAVCEVIHKDKEINIRIEKSNEFVYDCRE